MINQTDKGWSWVVLISTFLSSVNTGIIAYNFGIINVAFLQRYEQTVATTAVVGSVFLGALFITAPIASIVINRFSCRVAQITGGILAFIGFVSGFFVDTLELFSVTYGLLSGAGWSLCNTVSHVVVCFYFKKYLGLAFGLVVAGLGIGLLTSGPIIQYFIDIYGLHGAFLLLGGMVLNNVLFGSLIFPTKAEKFIRNERKKTKEEKAEKSDWLSCNIGCQACQWEIFKIKAFVVVLTADFFYSLPYAIIVFHLPNLSVLSGSSTEQAALLNTALGIGSAVNRLITGVVVGPGGIDPLLLFLGFNGILGVLSLTFPLYFVTHTNQFIFCVVHGTYTGGINAVRSPLYLHLVGLQYHSTAVGLIFFLEGEAFVIGPPLAGWIVDVTGSYENTFYIAGGCFIAAFLLTLISTIWKKIPIQSNATAIEEKIEEREQKYIQRRQRIF